MSEHKNGQIQVEQNTVMMTDTFNKTEFDNGKKNKIDTTKLTAGMLVKNYKEMCSLLNDTVHTAGNAKKIQLKNWSRYFDWKRDGHKFLILEVFDNPLPDTLPDNAIYARFMQLTLMDYLSKKPDGCYPFFTIPLMSTVGMVSKKYKDLRNGEDNYEEMFGIDGEVDRSISCIGAEQMVRISYNKLFRILDEALKSLEKHAIIHYNKEWAVKETPWVLRGGFRSATKDEEVVILKAEADALKKIGSTNLWYARACRGKEFQKYMSEYIHNELPELYGAIKWTVVVYGKPHRAYWDRVVQKIIDELKAVDTSIEMETLTDDLLVKLSKEALNKLVVNAVMQEANREAFKARQKIDNAFSSEKKAYFDNSLFHIANPDFIREFALLVNRYISIKESNNVDVQAELSKRTEVWNEQDDCLKLICGA